MRFVGRLAWASPLVAVAVLSAVIGLMAASTPAEAGNGNTISISPADATVTPDGSTTVDLVADPPADTLAVWLVRVAYDAEVVSVSACDPLDSPGGAAAATDCEDTGDDVVALGGVIFFGSGDGLSEESVLASITFEAEGELDECSSLEITVTSSLDPDGDETDPAITDGEICIAEGTPQIWGDFDCNGSVTIGDAQKIARELIALAVTQTQPCPGYGDDVTVDGNSQVWGDFDCNGSVTIGDAQKLARDLIALPITQTQPCPAPESQVLVS